MILAHSCGIVGCIIVCIQFIPQIYTTFKTKSSGSLSLFANLSQSTGMVVVVIFMSISTDQDFTAYLKFIVGSVIQFFLSFMQIYYDYILPRCKKNASTDLIDNKENQNGEETHLIPKEDEEQ